ncbi:MAG: thioredoxin domain-containing protein [Candidatus Micrarchaeota archaeon]
MTTEIDQDPKILLKTVRAAVVVFYAPLCGDCKISEEFESKLANEFADKIKFYRLDAVNLEEIADFYKVERYPTYVFFVKGKATRGILVEPVEFGEVKNWLEIQISRNRI